MTLSLAPVRWLSIFWVLCLVILVVEPVGAFVRPTTTKLATTRLQLYKSAQDAIAEAQRICAQNPNSRECQVAWDIVEEFQAADSHTRKQQPQQYQQQQQQPSMDLVTLLESFAILSTKIDGKMDQLKATCDKFEELGAHDPSVAELGRLAEEMKRGLVYVNHQLRQ